VAHQNILIDKGWSKFSTFALVGLLGLLSQMLWLPSIQAQALVEQRLCAYDGQYVVFAVRKLGKKDWDEPPQIDSGIGRIGTRNNLLLAHEHIIFCNGNRIERNIGFGNNFDGQRFSEEVSAREYFPFDNQRYDRDIISNILGPDSCRKSEASTYNLLTNNCQDFADRVRQEYWRRVLQGEWTGVLTQPDSRFNYTVSLKHTKDLKFVGTSRIEPIDDSRYFGVMELQGEVNDGVLVIKETRIKNQRPEPGFHWCLKKGDIQIAVSKIGTSLSGAWSDPGCNAGQVQLQQKQSIWPRR
jgi:hypothetical protein